MSKFVPAYDRRTGRKLPHYVPERLLSHPVWGETLRQTPRNQAGTKATTKAATETPADGDNTKEK